MSLIKLTYMTYYDLISLNIYFETTEIIFKNMIISLLDGSLRILDSDHAN